MINRGVWRDIDWKFRPLCLWIKRLFLQPSIVAVLCFRQGAAGNHATAKAVAGQNPKKIPEKEVEDPLDSEQDASIMNNVHVAEKQAFGVVCRGFVGAWGRGSPWSERKQFGGSEGYQGGLLGVVSPKGSPGGHFWMEASGRSQEGCSVKKPRQEVWKEAPG